ncbi:MAG: hypothetical protein NC904_00740 [Candidatus Omnitrophica bacterium]|nr:hypothetical protein [Candidatus Omnitrophota bacterium]
MIVKKFFYHRYLWVEIITVSLILFFVVIVFTFPLILHINEAIPKGSEPKAVAMFQLYTMEWFGKFLEDGGSYWDAPFFYPYKGTLAWSEPQPLSCLLVWLLAKLTGYIFAYNIVLIAYLVSGGLATYLVSRLITQDRISNLFSAIWVSAGAYSLQQICAFPLVAVAFPLFTLFFSFTYIYRKKEVYFWLAVTMYICSWLVCKQLAFYLTLSLIIIITQFLGFSLPKLKFFKYFLAILIVGISIIPFSFYQHNLSQSMAFGWKIDEIKSILRFPQLFMPAYDHWLTSKIMGWKIYSWDIGIVNLLLIVLAVFMGILKSSLLNKYQKKLLIGLVMVSIVSIVLGFGHKLGFVINGRRWSLYHLFFNLPFIKFIRTPSRFVFFAILGVSILSSFSFSYLRGKIKIVKARLVFTLFFFILLFMEMWCMPISLVFPKKTYKEHFSVDDWLREAYPKKALLEIPAPTNIWPNYIDYETEAMLRSLYHGHYLVNGYATFFPPTFKQLRKAIEDDFCGRGQRYIRAYGLGYVLVHNHRISNSQLEKISKFLSDKIVYKDKDHTLYLLPNYDKYSVKDFLPQIIRLSNIPKEGKLYFASLSKKREEAILITPQDRYEVYFIWKDIDGKMVKRKVRFLSGIIIDSLHDGFYFRIIKKDKKVIQAKLIPWEEAVKYLRKEDKK